MRASINGTELFYTIVGRGRPILLMHGTGFDHTFFRPWLDPLGDQLQLVYYDSRGSGRSRRDGFSEVTIQTLIDDADALRAHFGLDRIVLYGHSFFGGYPALEYALRHSHRLDGLILDCTAPALDYEPVMIANAESRGTNAQVQEIINAFSGQIPDDEALRQAWQSVLPMYFSCYEPEIATRMIAQMRFSAAAFNHFSRLIPSMNVLDRLGEITTPTLVLAGRHDWVCPPAQGAERLAAGLPNSRLVIFEKSGHFPFIEEQVEYLRMVRDWLATLA